MKIKLQPALMVFLYIAVIMSAVSQLRYQLLLNPLWHSIFALSQYIINALSLLIIIINLNNDNWRIKDRIVFLFFLYFIYIYLISFLNDSLYVKEMLQHVLPWPLTFCACLLYSKHHQIPGVISKITVVGLALLCILSLPNIARHLSDYGRRGGVIFPIYHCFGFLSLSLLLNKRTLRHVFIVIVALLLMISTKRAGFVAVLIGVLFYFYVDAYVQGSLKRRLKAIVFYTVFVFAAVMLGFYLIDKYNINIIQRLNNILDDSGSNRVFIWEDIMNHFNSSSLIKKIFGHGFYSVYYDVQPYGFRRLAHCSFIEYLYDFGVIGFLYTFLFSIGIIRKAIDMIKRKVSYAPAFSYTIPGMMMLTMVSYFYDQSVIIMPYVMLWGWCLGQDFRMKQQQGL